MLNNMLQLPRNINELMEVMRRLNHNPSMSDLQGCFTIQKRLSTGKGDMADINIVNFVRLIFKAYDKDNNGYISASEWSVALNKITGNNVSNELAAELFKLEKYDLDGDGRISFEEFVSYINDTASGLSNEQKERLTTLFPDTMDIKTFFGSIGINLSEEELSQIKTVRDKESNKGDIFEYNFENMCRALFRFTDKNNDGFVSPGEMQVLLGKLMGDNISVDVEDAITLIASVDENKDGQLDYREFISMFVKLAEWKENMK